MLENTCNKCISIKITRLPAVELTIYFLCSFIFLKFFHTLGRRTFRSIFECFSSMFFSNFSVLNKGRSKNSVTSRAHNLYTIYTTTQIQLLKFWWASKSNRNSCWKIFVLVVVPDKFWRHFVKFSLPHWSFLVQLFIGNIDACLRNFPNFSNTEAAFGWCSTKVVVLQKDMIRCNYCTFVVKSFEK